MKKMTMIAGVSALALAAPAFAEVEGEVTVGYSSQYSFRGVNFGDDLIEAGVSIGTELSGFSLGAGIWVGDTTEFSGDTEVDYYVSLGKDVNLGGIEGSVEVGYTVYTFPTEGATALDTEEVYISLGTTQFGIDWGLAFYRDLELIEEWYAEATAAKSFALCDNVSLDTELGVAYSFDYYGTDDISHLWAAVAVPFAISENATLSPYAKYVAVEDAAEFIGQKDEILGGIVLSVGF